MMREELLRLLVCPETHSRLELASNDLVSRINGAIAAGGVKNRAGQVHNKPLDGGLLRADGRVLYPIVDEIPLLLVDDAILLDQFPPDA